MNCEHVYALIPRESLTELVQQQARGRIGQQVHAGSRDEPGGAGQPGQRRGRSRGDGAAHQSRAAVTMAPFDGQPDTDWCSSTPTRVSNGVLCCCTLPSETAKALIPDRKRASACGHVDSVELRGLEPLTPSLRTRCATSCATAPWCGRNPNTAAPPVRNGHSFKGRSRTPVRPR